MSNKWKNIDLTAPELTYTGRINWDENQQPEFVFPATSLEFRFYGKAARLVLENHRFCWDNYVGAQVDGVQKCWKIEEEGTTEILLTESDEEKEHEILFFKRMDSCHTITLKSLEVSEESILHPAKEQPKLCIEVYGDSVSAGEVSEAVEYVGQPDPEHQGEYSNSWYSYAWITARKLNARLWDIAQGGISLLDGSGWVEPPIYLGMESVWDKVKYHPRGGEATKWDFTKMTPQVVVVALGQNDSHPEDYMAEDYEGEKARNWRTHYEKWILQIKEKYPKAKIILATTILEHSANWDKAIEEVCNKLNHPDITHFLYTKNGTGTKGHIRIPEAEKMAEELSAYIKEIL